MSNKLVEIKDLSVNYNGVAALEKVNLEIFQNDFIGIIGPNGGGKTTLVKAILGLLKPSKGKVIKTFSSSQSGNIGYLPQVQKIDYKFPITVKDVVMSGLSESSKLLFSRKKERIAKVEESLEGMGISHLINKAIGSLSGGERQRVLLCRSIISNPELLILDEPNSFVDNKFENDLYEKLKQLNERMSILLVSHDIGTISYYIKSIACVNKKLHYHKSNVITDEQLASYDCPIQIITHGHLPHTVLKEHES
jgi:zinc transport system ATP-binding protein